MALGDASHIVRLRKLGDGDYAWDTDVALRLRFSISAADVANGIVGLLTAADVRSDSALRADYCATFPHTASVHRQLFSLDSLLASRNPTARSS